jgi:hypothetical protein
MKREMIRLGMHIIGLGTILLTLLSTGCARPVVATAPARTIVVRESPPAPREEVIGVAPSTDHVWVRGYWLRSNNRWAWVPGHYERRPRAGVAWVEGHWDRTSRGWVWTPGHWE